MPPLVVLVVVDLDVFRNFNKMKTLSTDPRVIAKALSESSLLEVRSIPVNLESRNILLFV